ncbi:MAG: segregation/condensation protein A [Patescibacteria group bacterium]|nr:segregation/condensation protein A [Patescibacteria group bacterium]
MSSDFRVKNQHFEGPLCLLLELIEKQKLDITQLSLVEVTDSYLTFIESQKFVNLSNLSEFLMVASQLILLKSKALLPLFEFTKEEEDDIRDLEERLKEYQRFKKAATDISGLLKNNQISFSKKEEQFRNMPLISQKITSKELYLLFTKILQNVPSKEEISRQVIEDVISIEEKIIQLGQSIERRMKVAFQETISHASDKIEVIVTFLAMLEMMKQQIISVKQEKLLGEIIIEKR